jgi:hypothetical protein
MTIRLFSTPFHMNCSVLASFPTQLRYIWQGFTVNIGLFCPRSQPSPPSHQPSSTAPELMRQIPKNVSCSKRSSIHGGMYHALEQMSLQSNKYISRGLSIWTIHLQLTTHSHVVGHGHMFIVGSPCNEFSWYPEEVTKFHWIRLKSRTFTESDQTHELSQR